MQDSDNWGQNCQGSSSSMPELSFDEIFDATDFAPGPTDDNTSRPKISSLSSNDGEGLFPKGSIGKPIRRRSRASKKAPTTLLTDTNNFRALVQKFTGCHSVSPAFGTHKGPINLNFEQYKCYSEKPETSLQQQKLDWNLHEEYLDQNLFSFGTKNVASVTNTAKTTATADNHELLVSRVNQNPRAYPSLNSDDVDIDNFSIQELSGPGDHSTALAETMKDEFWGY